MNKKTFKPTFTRLQDNQVYVYFGSTVGRIEIPSLRKFGAKDGRIEGVNGQCYAIPCYNYTGDFGSQPRKLIDKEFIQSKIKRLYVEAIKNPKKEYLIPYYGLDVVFTGYTKEDMGKLFSSYAIPNNILFDEDFNEFIKWIK